MADAAAIWQSRMASALAGAPDEDKMGRLRETLMAYVTVWGAGVDTYSPRIRSALPRLATVSDDDWRVIALESLDAEVAEGIVAAVAELRLLARTGTHLAEWTPLTRPEAANQLNFTSASGRLTDKPEA